MPSIKNLFWVLATVSIFVFLLIVANSCFQSGDKKLADEASPSDLADSAVAEPVEKNYRFEIPVDDFDETPGIVRRGQVFSDILLEYNVSWEQIIALADSAKGIFNLAKIRAGNEYSLFTYQEDSTTRLAFMLYEISATDYLRVSLKDSTTAKLVSIPITTEVKVGKTEIKSSLYEAFLSEELPVALALKLSNIYAWTVDFYRLNKKDRFHFIYEEEFAEGESVGVGNIMAALYVTGDDTIDAFRFHHDSLDADQYFNSKGENLQKSMLKSPVKFGRISSRFSRRRFHPVQKRYKAHLGTDYAASYGTPIIAVGNGTVVAAKRGRYNGNYVKIRHNNTYTSQYLHMSKFAKGMRAGKKVQQGEVIGYVGATGLATGPHVCFRLWKNGRQVNHLAEQFSPAAPLPNYQWADFKAAIAPLQNKMSGLQ